MEILISILAVYGLTTIIVDSGGPFHVFDKLRSNRYLGAFHCFMCMSLYISAIIALWVAQNALEYIIYTLAYSGGAMFLYSMGN